MHQEIERKFLPAGDGWRALAGPGAHYAQGYLLAERGRTVRVRLAADADGERGFLTIKGPAGSSAIARAEYEYLIPAADARELLALCLPTPIEKTRYRIPLDGLVWEVDEFHGANEGLVLIEVELASEDQEIALPDWVGLEVSHDARYKNAVLSRNPYREWGEKERGCFSLSP